MTRQSFLRHSFALIAGASLAGCAAFEDDPAVVVTLVNVEPAASGGGLGEASLAFVVRLENASPEPLKVEGSAQKLYLNGTYVGQGLSNRHFEIAGLSSETDRVEVHLSTIRLATSLLSILKSEQVSYRLDSTVYGSKGSGRSRSFKSQREGQVKMSDFTTPTSPATKTAK